MAAISDIMEKTFGAHLRLLRVEKKLTQIEFAEAVGVDQTTVSRWERDIAYPEWHNLEAISKILKVSMDVLLYYSDKLSLNVVTKENADDLRLHQQKLDTVSVRVVGEVKAGSWVEPHEYEDMQPVEIPVISKPSLRGVRQYGLYIRGTSMNREFNEGDIIIVASIDDLDRPPKHNQRVVVERRRPDGLIETTCKIYKSDGLPHPELHPYSTDAKYQNPIALDDGTDGIEVRVTGIVVGKYVDYDL